MRYPKIYNRDGLIFIKSFKMDYKKPKLKEKYENFIDGKFAPLVGNEYFENNSPIDNTLIAKYTGSQKEDIDHAVIAANKAKEAWGNTSAAKRAGLLNKVADIIEANLEEFALVETITGQLIMQYASKNLNPVTMELGGKSPNIFFNSVMDADDAFLDKAIEGAVLFAFNQGEVCTCPSRLLVQEDIYDAFMARVIERTEAIIQDNPYDVNTMVGAQASNDQYEKILSYLKIGKEEGAKVLTGGAACHLDGDLANGFYIQPTILEGHNKMRVFQEEIFGPVVAVTKFKDEAEALEIANDTLYGLGAGVWSRDAHQLYQIPRAIKAGRVWVNCYHAYPAHAPFGGYKKSGFGRETHLMMMNHYRQTKNMLISYDKNKLGFF